MLRTRIAGIIDTHIGDHLTEEQRTALERGIYNTALAEAKEHGVRRHWDNPDFAAIYKTIARRTVSNVDPATYVGNARLLERLKDGEFTADAIASMTHRELYPEHWQALADEQLKRETTMLEGSHEEGSDMFKCKRCGKSRTRYWEMQTRSADEPMTIFIRCLNCGKEWRQ
jgi:DNA-directed RNA polymerase subunit M/transcription elongation factor TFIIS